MVKNRKILILLGIFFTLLFSAEYLEARPILDSSFNQSLSSIEEDVTSNSGDSIADMIIDGSIQDVTGVTNSIAVISVDNTDGIWQYSLDNGSSWINFSPTIGSIASFANQGILLSGVSAGAATNRIRFVPNSGYPNENSANPDYNGKSEIHFTAWNETEGLPGETYNTLDLANEAVSFNSDLALIEVLAVNDDPIFYFNDVELTAPHDYPNIVLEGAPEHFFNYGFTANDVDLGENQLILELCARNGIININTDEANRFLSGNNSSNVTIVTNISNMNQLLTDFTYTSDFQFSGTDTLCIRLNDQGKSGIGGGEDVFYNIYIEVELENHAPVLDDDVDHYLTSIFEDEIDPVGTSISDIITPTSIYDINDPIANEAIAIIGMDNSSGIWQYSLDNGTSYNNISSSTGGYVNIETNALLLNGELTGAQTNTIRFIPNPNYEGTSKIRFRAWDLSVFAAGDQIDATINGDYSSISSEYDTAEILIISQNDAPGLWYDTQLIESQISIFPAITDPFEYHFTALDNIHACDCDIADNQLVVNITATKGIITVNNASRFIANNGTSNVTIAARINDVNSFLQDFTYTANLGETGVESLLFVVDDLRTRLSVDRYINFQLSNSAPTFTSIPIITTLEDGLYIYNVATQDLDGNDLVFGSENLPSWLTLTDNGNGTAILSGTPLNEHVGNHNIKLLVSDPYTTATPTEQIFVLEVQNTNDAPIFTSTPITETDEDALYTYNIITEDDDVIHTLSIAAIIKPAWLTLTDNGDGTATLFGTPDNDEVGFHNITLTVSDGIAVPATEQIFILEVINTNDDPYVSLVIPDQIDVEDFNNTNTINLDNHFADDDALANFTYSVVFNSLEVDATVEANMLILNSVLDFVGTTSITVTADDNATRATVSDTFTLTLNPVNDAPIFTSTPVTAVNEDAVYTYNITTYDPDAMPTIVIADVTIPSWLSFTNNGDGTATLTGIPLNIHVGNHSVSLSVSDGTAPVTYQYQDFIIQVVNTNDAPVVLLPIPDQNDIEDFVNPIQLDMTNYFSDEDLGNILTYSVNYNSAEVTVSVNGDIVELNSVLDFFGTTTITVTANDNVSRSTVSDSFDLILDPINDAPTFTSTPILEVDEDALYNYVITTNDVDPLAILTIIDDSIPAWMTFIDNGDGTASLTGTADNTLIGFHNVTISLTDGIAAPVTQTYIFEVKNTNDTPEVAMPLVDFSFNEDTTDNSINLTNVFTDIDMPYGDLLAYSSDPNSNIQIDIDQLTGIVTLTPNPDYTGIETLVFTATDAESAFISDDIIVTIINVEDEPVFASTPITYIVENQLYDYQIVAADVDPSPTLTITGETIPAWLTFNDNGDGTASLIGTPLNAHVGMHSVLLKVSDGIFVVPTEQSFIITVGNTNNPPFVSVSLVDFAFDEDTVDTSLTLDNNFGDLDLIYGDELTYTFAGNSNITVGIDQATSIVTLSPAQDWFGSENIQFIATDTFGESIMDDVIVTINNINDAPVIILPDTFTFDEDAILIEDFTNYATDADPDMLTLSVTGNTEVNIAFNGLDVTFTSTLNWSGSETLTFTVSDNTSRVIASDDVIVNVTEINDVPYVDTALIDFSIDEESVDTSINLNNVFSDYDLIYGDALTYTYANNINITVSIDPLTGIVTLEPAVDWFGTETIEFTATDLASTSIMDDVIITVDNINDAPTIVLPDSFDFAENNSLVEDFSAYITDADPDALTLSVTGNTDVIVDITGLLVTFTATADWSGSETLTFSVDDNETRAISSDDVIVNVTPISDAPIVQNPLIDFSIDEDTVDTSIDLYNVFTDADLIYGDALTFTFANNTNIAVEIDALTGIVTLTPANDWVGSETIQFTATDLSMSSISDDVLITVNNVNDAPIVVIEIPDVIMDEDTTDNSLNLMNHFSDPDLIYGDQLTYSYTGNGNLTITIDQLTGGVTIVPNPDWIGTESIIFTATDLDGASVSDEILLTVSNVNDDPIIELPDTFSFDEDTTLDENFITYITDIDPDVLTLTVTGNTDIIVNINNLDVIFSAPANWFGTETLTFTVNDNATRAITTDDVIVTVNSINDVPEIISPLVDITIDEDNIDSSIILNSTFSDNDIATGDELVYTFTGNTNITVEIDPVTTVVTLTPDANWSGTETIEFTATDLTSASVMDDVIVTVSNVNDAPTIDLPDTFSFDEDTTLNENFIAYITDIDPDVLTLTVTGNTDIIVDINNLDVMFSAPANWFGTETLTFTVNDNATRAIATDDVIVTVNSINDVPEIISPLVDITIDEDNIDSSIILNNTFSDNDIATGDELAFTFTGNTNITVEIDPTTTVVTLTPDVNWFGTETIEFTATDFTGLSVMDDVIVTVNTINDIPTFTSTPITFAIEGDTYQYDITSEDQDMVDTIVISATTLPIWLTFTDNNDGTATLSGTPANEHVGTHNVVLSITDGIVVTDVLQEFEISVINSNSLPYVENPLVDFSFDEDTIDTSISLNSVFSDPDLIYGDELTYSFSGNLEITVEVDQTTSIVTLTPANNWFGIETILFTATDLSGDSISDDVIVTVINVNDDPTITLPDNLTFAEEGTLVEDFTPYLDDIDPDVLTLSVSGNTEVNVVINDLEVTFTATANWYGTETLTFTVNDNAGRAIDTDQVDVIVTPVNDDPTITLPAAFTFAEEGTLVENFVPYLDDIDPDVLTLSVTGNSEVNVAINDLEVTFTATANWNGTETLTFTVNDNAGRAIDTDQVDVTVTFVNDAPTVQTALVDFSMDEDTTDNSIDLDNIFTDLDLPYGDELTYSFSGNTNIDVAINATTGVVTFTPDSDWNGAETIEFTATDEASAEISDNIMITVENLNDAPTVENALVDFSMDEDTIDNNINLDNIFTDVDFDNGDELTYSFNGNTNIDVVINQTSGIVTITPNEDWFGVETIEFTATDNSDANVSDDITVTVNDVNDAPEITNPELIENVVVYLDEPKEIDLDELFDDSEQNSSLVFSIITFNPDEILATIIDGHILRLEPVNEWIGDTSITISANDGISGRALTQITFDIKVDAIYNHPEVAIATNNIDFGVVFVNESSNTENFTIVNQGHADLNISVINAPSNFKIRLSGVTDWTNSIAAFTLAEGINQIIEIRFLPTDQLVYNATITINSDAVLNPAVDIDLTGDTRNQVPNAFTPNGDGKNDLFTISLGTSSNEDITLFIYNARGKKIREIDGSASVPISWDGKDDDDNTCKASPYLYYILQDGSRVMRGKVYLVK